MPFSTTHEDEELKELGEEIGVPLYGSKPLLSVEEDPLLPGTGTPRLPLKEKVGDESAVELILRASTASSGYPFDAVELPSGEPVLA